MPRLPRKEFRVARPPAPAFPLQRDLSPSDPVPRPANSANEWGTTMQRCQSARSAAFGFLFLSTGVARGEVTPRLSLDRNQGDTNGASHRPAMTPDGRYVVWAADASDLVSGDRNGVRDIFVRDRHSRRTERVSRGRSGAEANGASDAPAISADGRYVVFSSRASNLVAGDGNGQPDVFVFDRRTSVTSRLSVDGAGAEADGASSAPAIRNDGTTVAFVTAAGNLVPGDGNGVEDVLVVARSGGAPALASIADDGSAATRGCFDPSLSGDRRFVAFTSSANLLASADGNGHDDVFVRDRLLATTVRASGTPSGGDADGGSRHARLSEDGRLVVFESDATDLVAGDGNGASDVFVHDLLAAVTARQSVDSASGEAAGDSRAPALSTDGRWIVFESDATTLVGGDLNGVRDVFVRDRDTGMVVRASEGAAGEAHGASQAAVISADGAEVAFLSIAGDVGGADPELNTTFVLTFVNSAGQDALALLLVGSAPAEIVTNLQGTLLVAPFLGQYLDPPAAGLAVDCPVEGDPSSCGVRLYAQLIQEDPGTPCGAAFSKGYEITLGY